MNQPTQYDSSESRSNRPIRVGVCLSLRSWRGDLQRHCRDHVADVVVHLLHDGNDAIAADLDVVVVDDETSWLSAPFVTQARDHGLSLIGLFDGDELDGFGQNHLFHLGIDRVAPAAIDVDELLTLIRTSKPDRELADRFDALTSAVSDRRAVDDRQIVAIGGPAGSGATEVSVGMAMVHAFASRTVLVDVDESHPTLARRLGLGIYPHILNAIDAIRGETNDLNQQGSTATVQECLAQSALGRPKLPFDVVVGLVTRDDWSLTDPNDVADLVVELAARWDLVLVRLGPQLEDLSRYVDRYGASRVAATKASRVVGVCDCTSTGVLRFVDWMVDLLALVGDAPVDLVLNRAPSKAVAKQVEAHIREITGDRIGEIVVAPRDRQVQRSAWDAAVPARGQFMKAIRALEHPRLGHGSSVPSANGPAPAAPSDVRESIDLRACGAGMADGEPFAGYKTARNGTAIQ